MVGWYHQCNGHECEQTPGGSEGQGSLACCSPCGCKESDTTYRLNNSSSNKASKKRRKAKLCTVGSGIQKNKQVFILKDE